MGQLAGEGSSDPFEDLYQELREETEEYIEQTSSRTLRGTEDVGGHEDQ